MAGLTQSKVKYTIDFTQRGYAFLQGEFSLEGDSPDRLAVMRQIDTHVGEIFQHPLDWSKTSGCYWISDQLGKARGSARPGEMAELQRQDALQNV